MADPNTPKDPADPAAAGSDESLMHKRVFKKKPDGTPDETPAQGSDAGAAFGVSPVQLERTDPMRHIGDSDLPDFQPDGGRRR